MTDKEIREFLREQGRWKGMKNRCRTDPRYVGRGIKVCDEWLGKEGFIRYYLHVSQLPHYGEKGYSLDRIDNDGNYEPGNVRWATAQMQKMNRQITIRDQEQTLQEISNETGLSIHTIRRRWYTGDRGDWLRRPQGVSSRVLIEDRGQTLHEISKSTGIHLKTIKNRWWSGDRGDRLRRPTGTKKDDYPNE